MCSSWVSLKDDYRRFVIPLELINLKFGYKYHIFIAQIGEWRNRVVLNIWIPYMRFGSAGFSLHYYSLPELVEVFLNLLKDQL